MFTIYFKTHCVKSIIPVRNYFNGLKLFQFARTNNVRMYVYAEKVQKNI